MAEPVTSRLEREIFFRMFARSVRPPEAAIEQFVESLIEEQIPRGAVLFQAGQPSDTIHYVVRGALELRDPSGQAAPWTFGTGAAIGGIDAVQGQPYSRIAVAVEDTLLLKVRFEDYFEILEDNFEFAKTMLGVFHAGVEELSRSLPADLVFVDRQEAETELLAQVASAGLVERVLVLRAAGPWPGVRLQVLVRLAQEATERWLNTGEPLFEFAQSTEALWFVARGKIVAERRDPPLQVGFGPATMVLPHAGLAGAETRYRALAAGPSLVLALRKEDLWDVMEDHPDVIRALLAHGGRERARLQTIAADLAAARAAHQEVPPSP